MTVFFAVVLGKKFTNPSSDIIEVLAGLDNVDTVFFDLVAALDHAIKDGRTSLYIRFRAMDSANNNYQRNCGRKPCELPLQLSLGVTRPLWCLISFTVISSQL